jgi:hypothetical protein
MVNVTIFQKTKMNTKTIFKTSLALMLVTTMLHAQDKDSTDRIKTIFSGKMKKAAPKYLGIYASPEFQYGQINGTMTPMIGGSAGILIDKKMSIGFGGFVTARGPQKSGTASVMSAFGGPKLEYTFNPNSPVHISIPLLFGAGYARTDTLGLLDRDGRNKGRDWGKNGNGYFVLQPGINLEANVFRVFKIFAGASYRISKPFDSNTGNTSSTALNGFSANVGLKVGFFDFKLSNLSRKNRKLKTRAI